MFQACQAYANGVIGANAYALILGRYGQLTTTLFLGQDIAGIPQVATVAASPAISATATAAPSSTSGAPNATVSVPAGTAPASVSSAVPAPAANAAYAVTRMNEDYLNLDYNTVHSLAIVCLNRGDPTSYAASNQAPWLDGVCGQLAQLMNLGAVTQLGKLETSLVTGNVLAKPVDPTTTTTLTSAAPKTTTPSPAPGAKTPASAKATTPTCTPMTTAQKATVDQVLFPPAAAGASPAPNPPLSVALNNFETHYGLAETGCPVGQIGSKTLTVIEALAAAAQKKP